MLRKIRLNYEALGADLATTSQMKLCYKNAVARIHNSLNGLACEGSIDRAMSLLRSGQLKDNIDPDLLVDFMGAIFHFTNVSLVAYVFDVYLVNTYDMTLQGIKRTPAGMWDQRHSPSRP